MVDGIEEGGFVDVHPLEEFGDDFVEPACVGGVDNRCGLSKTYRLVVSNSISQVVDFAKLFEHVRIIVLTCEITLGLFRKDLQQSGTCGRKMRWSE